MAEVEPRRTYVSTTFPPFSFYTLKFPEELLANIYIQKTGERLSSVVNSSHKHEQKRGDERKLAGKSARIRKAAGKARVELYVEQATVRLKEDEYDEDFDDMLIYQIQQPYIGKTNRKGVGAVVPGITQIGIPDVG